ncbi:MAG: hypothetical protein ACP5HU_06240 [Phycisphaerae bacterium]
MKSILTRASRPASFALVMFMVAGCAAAQPVELEAKLLGEEADEPVGRWDGDRYILKGRGSGMHPHEERGGGYAHVTTDALNFSFTARIAEAPEEGPYPRYGICVRTGAGAYDRMLLLRYAVYDQHRCVQWYYRHGVASSTHAGANRTYRHGLLREMDEASGYWLRVVREYPVYRLYISTDGEDWREVASDYCFTLMDREVTVGLLLTSGSQGQMTSAVFDNISFVETPADEDAVTEELWQQFRPPMETWEMHLTQADSDEGEDTQGIFILKPESLAFEDIRALYYTTGSKEVMLSGRRKMQWDGDVAKRRKPSDMETWEGVYKIDDLRYWYSILGHYRIARIGGAFRPEHYESAIRELAEQTGAENLPNLPFVATGGSAAGEAAASAARLMPERTAAVAPALIGMAGANTDDPYVLNVPHLHVIGSKDGPHLKDVMQRDSGLREKGALWAQAPMWWGYHAWWRADQIMVPYFLRLIDMRVPEGADASAGPVELVQLDESDGYIGLNDTWDGNWPVVLPFPEATEEQRRGDASWLPDEFTARLWQAFVANWPRTVIHFPRFDGNEGFGFTRPQGREIHFMEANRPFNLLASGPIGENVTVEYYAGLRKLEVLHRYRDNPYMVRLEALPPGLHVLYAITTVDGEKEICWPQPILFQSREQDD